MVECQLPKLKVASSSLVARSKFIYAKSQRANRRERFVTKKPARFPFRNHQPLNQYAKQGRVSAYGFFGAGGSNLAGSTSMLVWISEILKVCWSSMK